MFLQENKYLGTVYFIHRHMCYVIIFEALVQTSLVGSKCSMKTYLTEIHANCDFIFFTVFFLWFNSNQLGHEIAQSVSNRKRRKRLSFISFNSIESQITFCKLILLQRG